MDGRSYPGLRESAQQRGLLGLTVHQTLTLYKHYISPLEKVMATTVTFAFTGEVSPVVMEVTAMPGSVFTHRASASLLNCDANTGLLRRIHSATSTRVRQW